MFLYFIFSKTSEVFLEGKKAAAAVGVLGKRRGYKEIG